MMPGREGDMLLVIGLGYSGTAIAARAVQAGFSVTATARDPARVPTPPGVRLVPFGSAGAALFEATHLIVTAPPDAAEGDPLLSAHAPALAAAPALRWIGYLSTTGVYGDRDGTWVDEATPPAPGQERSRRRLAAEEAWRQAAAARGAALDIFRVGGIYGPGRSALDDLRDGTARRVVKPGHAFGRIHVADIARATIAAASQDRPEEADGAAAARVLHLVDDLPVEASVVVEEAARLLGVPPPPAVPFERALASMSPMARSFWAENRKVSCAATRSALGLAWRYPTYREGLRGILAAQRDQEAPAAGAERS
jgi:nucleoside-diphosphate-sugar epimerase